MVIKARLTDLSDEKTKLVKAINRKIAASKTTKINENIDSKLKIDIKIVSNLLESFEARLRECEMLYFAYLKDVNHDILCLGHTRLPLLLHIEFSYGTSVLKKEIEINDRELYRDVINEQFRHYILAMSSLYEVIVKLAEILIRKVVLHAPGKRPLSAPLDQYILLLENLVELRYRKRDNYYNCIKSNKLFFDQYLSTISLLRNSFAHGFAVNLESDSANYKVTKFDTKKFTSASPELNLDFFSRAIMENSRAFFKEMLTTLEKSIKQSSIIIPA